MDTKQFLDRLLPPGNFLAITHRVQNGGITNRFYPRTDTGKAASFIKFLASQNPATDVWHACASYRDAVEGLSSTGKPKLIGERTQANVQALKAFWVDMDVARPGDGKAAGQVFPDAPAAIAWLKSFMTTMDIPRPNLLVHSGYGMHGYWITEDPMDPATWQQYADALKYAALQSNAYGCDLSIMADSARILRPPGSVNAKDPSNPMPVWANTKIQGPDFVNAELFAKLQPYVGLMVSTPATTTVAAPSMGALAGGGPAAAFAGHTSAMTAVAAKTTPLPKDKSFALIAEKCAQVKYSLDTGGANDKRPIWYLGNLSLAYHTNDGASFVHEVSKGHKDYTQASIDAAMQQIDAEKAKKDTGPPRCTAFNGMRPGICNLCPHFGKILSPWNLGAKDGDLPKGYRRHEGRLQRSTIIKDEPSWVDVVPGDLHSATLTKQGAHYAIKFLYEYAGQMFPVSATMLDAGAPEPAKQYSLWVGQGVAVDRFSAQPFGDFTMAWIKQLRHQQAVRTTVVEPFGWAESEDGDKLGLAIAGTLYKKDGTTEAIAGGDQQLLQHYSPRGTLDKWKQAADFVTAGRPDLQTMVAASMGAPLMKFTGEPGVVLNFYSLPSGVGKSSGCKVAQTVWGATTMMSALDDTANQMRTKIAGTKVIPCIWDEMRVSDDNARSTIETLFAVAQGKDKGRLGADAKMKPIGEWQTILITAGNAPIMDWVKARSKSTDAGAVRLMEFNLGEKKFGLNTAAGVTIEECTRGVGTAGQELAAYYAANVDETAKRVQELMHKIGTKLKCEPNERFYIAGVACIFAAAEIANKIGLAKFDVTGMFKFVEANWLQLRVARGEMVVNNGKMDYVQVFGDMYSDVIGDTVKTTEFRRRGRTAPNFKVLEAPLNNKTVKAQISVDQMGMRVSIKFVDDWCRKAGLSPALVIQAWTDNWGAFKEKAVLGAGTGWPSGQVPVLFIPLSHPDLSNYDPTPDAPATAARAAPTTVVAGNQPKAA